MRPRIMTVAGTGPEAIKVAPAIEALEASGAFDGVTATTGQHRYQVNEIFGISPDHHLDVVDHGATLAQIFARAPLPHGKFTRTLSLSLSTATLTDSGGVQERSPSLGNPADSTLEGKG